MRDPSVAEEVRRRLLAAVRDPRQPYPGGASEEDIAGLERRLDRALPADYRDWLRLCPGEAIGPGYVLGTRTDHNGFFDPVADLDRLPDWRARGWLPIANDGFGNPYLLVLDGPLAGLVGFVEVIGEPDQLTYLVASDVWRFFRFFLAADAGEGGWPFDQAHVLAHDPDLAHAPSDLLPWNL